MADYSASAMDRLVKLVLFHEWRQLIAAGYLTDDGLLAVRGRVADGPGEFLPGPELDAMFLCVSDAIARRLGLDPAYMPGVPLVPDFPPDPV